MFIQNYQWFKHFGLSIYIPALCVCLGGWVGECKCVGACVGRCYVIGVRVHSSQVIEVC